MKQKLEGSGETCETKLEIVISAGRDQRVVGERHVRGVAMQSHRRSSLAFTLLFEGLGPCVSMVNAQFLQH